MDSNVILNANARLLRVEAMDGNKRGSEQGNCEGGFCWHMLLFEPWHIHSLRIPLVRFGVLPGRRQRPATTSEDHTTSWYD